MWALGTYSQCDERLPVIVGWDRTKFPTHKGIAVMKEMNERQLSLQKQKSQEPQETEWVNKQAPELALPDIKGKEIKLSSFKGKYVLVDFWQAGAFLAAMKSKRCKGR